MSMRLGKEQASGYVADVAGETGDEAVQEPQALAPAEPEPVVSVPSAVNEREQATVTG
ncbi:MAG: hypothetical protein J2P25_26565 [Nocardiopsaceae bacterium]|nr:hypothetical protein [Nocardiopsaceae bacterium]